MKKLVNTVLAALLLLSCCACTDNGKTDNPQRTYATVNGEIVTVEEVDYFASRSRSKIMLEYAEKYDVEDFSDFWDKEFDGKTPTQALEECAFEQAVEAKIKLIEMQKNDIYEDVSYRGLKAKAEQFNKSHENAPQSVGLTSIDLDSFYTYYISTGEMELKNRLAKGELKPTDEEIAAYKIDADIEVTDEFKKSKIVEAKYEKYIAELVNSAAVEKK